MEGGFDGPLEGAGFGVEAEEGAVAVFVEALADDEVFSVGGEGGGGEEGLEVVVAGLVECQISRPVSASRA